MLLSLLFLIWVGILFLAATGEISVGVAVRSQLTRICEEIALNVARAGLDEDALQAGDLVLHEPRAHAIAVDAFARSRITGPSFTVNVVGDEIVVRATVGSISALGVATPRRGR
jgi:hypothetical protein